MLGPIIILAGTLFLCIIGLIWKLIDWKEIAEKWVGNNPERAFVYVRAGDTVRCREGERFYKASEGQLYHYRLEKEYNDIVAVKTDYPYVYLHGRRIIGISDGQIVPDPLGFMSAEELAKYKEGAVDMSALTQGDTMVKVVHSVKSNRAGSIMLYIIIGLIVIAGIYYFVTKMQSPVVTPSANVTQPAVTVPAPAPGAPQIIITPTPTKTIP